MTILQLYKRISEELRCGGVENCGGEVRFILERAFGEDFAMLYAKGREEAESAAAAAALEYALKRSSGQPLQYVLGEAGFMGLNIKVAPGVLIPRPETEGLCRLALEEIKASGVSCGLSLLDLCTGSGCIGAWAAGAVPGGEIFAADISPAAIEAARGNCPAGVRFFLGDLFDAREHGVGKNASLRDFKFDVIISNPPYIPEDYMEKLEAQVKDYEPRLALDGGREGMAVVGRIIKEAPAHIKPGGLLLMEIDESHAAAVLEACAQACGYAACRILRDLAGKDRYLWARTAKQH